MTNTNDTKEPTAAPPCIHCGLPIVGPARIEYGEHPSHPFQEDCFKALKARVERSETALTKISAIRDSIVGAQAFNWSEHAYPLVAALKEAGYDGAGYEIARENLGTLLEQINGAEARIAAALAVVKEWERDGASVVRGPVIIARIREALTKP